MSLNLKFSPLSPTSIDRSIENDVKVFNLLNSLVFHNEKQNDDSIIIQYILIHRFGLFRTRRNTYKDLANFFGFSSVQLVSKLIKKGLRMLVHPSRSHHLEQIKDCDFYIDIMRSFGKDPSDTEACTFSLND